MRLLTRHDLACPVALYSARSVCPNTRMTTRSSIIRAMVCRSHDVVDCMCKTMLVPYLDNRRGHLVTDSLQLRASITFRKRMKS